MLFKLLPISTFVAAIIMVSAMVASGHAANAEHKAGGSGHGTGHETGHDAGHEAQQGEGVVQIGGLQISGAWTRATVKAAKVGAGYLTIRNQGTIADQLLSVTSDVSEKTGFHSMEHVGNVMQMRHLEGPIDIPAGGEVIFQPGGQHLMFLDLKSPFVEGMIVNVRLNFAVAGQVEVPFKIGALAAKGPLPHAH